MSQLMNSSAENGSPILLAVGPGANTISSCYLLWIWVPGYACHNPWVSSMHAPATHYRPAALPIVCFASRPSTMSMMSLRASRTESGCPHISISCGPFVPRLRWFTIIRAPDFCLKSSIVAPLLPTTSPIMDGETSIVSFVFGADCGGRDSCRMSALRAELGPPSSYTRSLLKCCWFSGYWCCR